jgi:hypothetical protein
MLFAVFPRSYYNVIQWKGVHVRHPHHLPWYSVLLHAMQKNSVAARTTVASHYATGRKVHENWRREIFFSSSIHPVRLCDHSASYSMYTELFYPGIKREGREADHHPAQLSRWPFGLRRMYAAACLRGSRVRISPRLWMFVSCVCCVLCRQRPLRIADHSFRGVLLCMGVHACVCVAVGDLETSTMRRPRSELGFGAKEQNPLLLYNLMA